MMAASKNDGFQYRCPFCHEEDEAMLNPRLLPCKHEVCLGCLKDYLKHKMDPCCELCGVMFDRVAVDDLPKLEIVYCMACRGKGQRVTAASYCLKCENPMCQQHIENHNDLFGSNNHEVMTMYQYLRAGQKLKAYCCSKHPDKKLDGRCTKCLEFDCISCRSFAKRSCPKGESHASEELPDVERRVTEQVGRLHQALDSLRFTKKEASDKLACSDRRCHDMKLEALKQREQQIQAADDELNLASQKIDGWSDGNHRRLDCYFTELDKRERSLRQLYHRAKSLLAETHTIDIINGDLDVKLMQEVEHALDKTTQPLDLPELVLVSKAKALEEKHLHEVQVLNMSLQTEQEKSSELETKLAVAEAKIQDEILQANAQKEKDLLEIEQLKTSSQRDKEKSSELENKLAVAEAKIQDEISKAKALEEKYLLEIKQLKASLRREKVENNKKPSVALAEKMPMKVFAYCVSHAADGQLVVGRYGGFDFLDESGKILRRVENRGGDITGLSLYKGYVYVIHKAPGQGLERQVRKYSLQGELMLSWKVPDYKFISQLAVVQDRVYTRSDGNNLLLAYSLTGEQQPKHNIALSAVPTPDYLCAAPPDGLIISDLVNNLVAKYTTPGQQVWLYKGLNKPKGAFIDEFNRVWVASDDSRIHILSPEGQFICELTVPDVKKLLQLSISGDQLACAAYTDGLLLYSIEY